MGLLWGQGLEDEQNKETWDCWRWRGGADFKCGGWVCLIQEAVSEQDLKEERDPKNTFREVDSGQRCLSVQRPKMSVCLACSRNSIKARAVGARERAREHEVRQ